MSLMRDGSSRELPATIVDILRRRALEHPDRRAFTFLEQGEAETTRLTFAELDAAARGIARELRAHAAAGDRALLLYPPGLDFVAAFMGCLYAGVIAVPVHVPRSDRRDARIEGAARDCTPVVALSVNEALPRLKTDPTVSKLPIVATDELRPSKEKTDDFTPSPESLAFLQYTSGSTSRPRGVMVTHTNLSTNLSMIETALGHSESTVMISWLPVFHDMGLVGNTLSPIFSGYHSVHMPPGPFLQRPMRWLRAVTAYRATCIGAPNFAYEICVRRAHTEDLASIDLSTIETAYSGAEPVRTETLERFSAIFERCGFRSTAFLPCYGLAEATVFVTGGIKWTARSNVYVREDAMERHRIVPGTRGDPDTRALVSCGGPVDPGRVVIVDPESHRLCALGAVGEIWASGPHVAQGYWGDEDRSRETFGARVADTGEGPFLRTGDLGFMSYGDLFITGRRKDLIIIRGRNIYPQDVELLVQSSDARLRPDRGAAFAVTSHGQEHLAIVQEVEREELTKDVDWPHVAELIRETVFRELQIIPYAVILVRPQAIPTTTSGKIQRFACRAAFLEGSLAIVTAQRRSVPPEKFHLKEEPQ
jgi:acyl-CoA synthetase (AMP-forming)/AMP-acid ligase II